MSTVTDALRAARKDAGLSQRQLAEVLRLSPAFINDLEHGRRECGEKHYEKLPASMRATVMKAVVADLQERLARARRLMRLRDDDGCPQPS
jgi:transcriptional regulator with XRE-family HTH domain